MVLLLISSMLMSHDILALLADPSRIGGCNIVPSSPMDGSLIHERDGYMEQCDSNINVKDFIIEATFYNPYSSISGNWDYGFLFRSKNEMFHVVRVTSDKEWFHYVVINGEWNKIEDGKIYNLQVGADQNNHIYIIVLDNNGLLYVNGDFVALLNISRLVEKEDISVATGIAGDSEIEGKVTRFENFTVWSLDSHMHLDLSGCCFPMENGYICQCDSNINVKDFIIEATFYNPYSSISGNWDYGFLFRSKNEMFHVVQVTSDKEWFHYVVINGEWNKIEDGKIFGLQTGFRDMNHLCVIVLGQRGFFYVNGQFEAMLDTSELA